MDYQYPEQSLAMQETSPNVLACNESGKANASRGAMLPYDLVYKEEA
jgi:hypothetical protein